MNSSPANLENDDAEDVKRQSWDVSEAAKNDWERGGYQKGAQDMPYFLLAVFVDQESKDGGHHCVNDLSCVQ